MSASHLTLADAAGKTIDERGWPSHPDCDTTLSGLLYWIERYLGDHSRGRRAAMDLSSVGVIGNALRLRTANVAYRLEEIYAHSQLTIV